MNLITKWLDLVYPPSLYCDCCGNLIDETRVYNLCDHCVRHIKWKGEDIKDISGLKTLRCAEYGIYERTLIFSLKYSGKKYIARDIGKIMADRLSLEDISFDVIVPVPMYKAKERERGFNQAALITKYLAKETGKETLPEALIRTVNTKAMRGLNPMERENNVKNNFRVNEKYGKMLQDKTVLLVDDFFTTGSTAKEAKRVLMETRLKDLYFIAFAAKY